VEVVVLSNSTSDREPCYSPSGKKIAYTGYDGNDHEIYKINAGGGGKVQLTYNYTDAQDPDWGIRP
jgi:Tol biopolymer transport system component